MQARTDSPQLCVGCVERCTLLEERHRPVVVCGAADSPRFFRIGRARQPYLGLARVAESRRHNSNDFISNTFHTQRLAERSRARAEVPLREWQADDGAAPGIANFEPASECRRYAEDPEKARRDEIRGDELSVVGHLHAHLAAPIEVHLLQRRCSGANVREVRPGQARPRAPFMQVSGLQLHDAGGVGIVQRAQQDTVHHAEHRGVGADAERQRQHRDGGE